MEKIRRLYQGDIEIEIVSMRSGPWRLGDRLGM